jgi:two-component system, NarL family, nitrate/nitrite response regulator NarL
VTKLRVLLADDHPLMIAAVRSALEGEKDFEIVGEATSGSQVMPLVSSARPDVVLIDLRLPEVDGLACLERIRKKHPTVKVVFFSAVDEHSEIAAALARGACAYLVKSIDPGDLAAVVRQAVAGSFFCAGGLDGVAAPVDHNGNGAGLSERETEILCGVARGLSNRAIARELWLSDQTVKFHLHNIYRKLEVANRTEAARYAFDHGLAAASAAA